MTSGDHVKTMVWLHMDESLSVADYLTCLKKLKSMESAFDAM
jgi:hypothetical protein